MKKYKYIVRVLETVNRNHELFSIVHTDDDLIDLQILGRLSDEDAARLKACNRDDLFDVNVWNVALNVHISHFVIYISDVIEYYKNKKK